MKRKKRAKKSIKSLEKQIELHKEKQREAFEKGNEELYDYYEKELDKFENEKKRKEGITKR